MRSVIAFVLIPIIAAAVAGERDDAKARIQNIEQRLSDWDVPGAKRELAELEKLVPKGIEPLHYFRGRIAFEDGRYEEAVNSLSAAGVEDKPGSFLRLAKDTQKITKDYLHTESAHFIFYYPKGKDEILAPYALETLEAIQASLEKDLGFAPPPKTRVEVVSDAHELSKVSTLTYKQIATTGTIAICKFNKLMITSPKAVLKGYDWQDTLAHEFTHLVVSEKSRNTVPIWLHEGLAKYLESRWRGGPGLAMTPSTQALLGHRVKMNKLVPFEKMHPSIAMLPTAEDAATAFAEVFYAVDFLYKLHGPQSLRTVIDELASGKEDKKAIEAATHGSFAAFERAWLDHIRNQEFPKQLIPRTEETVVLKEDAAATKKTNRKKDKEASFRDFAQIEEPEARKLAHLGELMRERSRLGAAAEEFSKAHQLVGDKYESVSNKYALVLLGLRRTEEAEKVLQSSLRLHPGAAATNVHLGRIYLARKDYASAKRSYLDALSSDPFDEEIHIALAGIAESTRDKALLERSVHASSLLIGQPPDRVKALAKQFLAANTPAVELDLPMPSLEK